MNYSRPNKFGPSYSFFSKTLFLGLTVWNLIYLANASAGVSPQPATTLTTLDDGLRDITGYAYEPETQRVFFSAQPNSSTAPPPIKLYEVPVSGGIVVPRTFQSDDSRDSVMQWSLTPDGQHILFRQSDHGSFGNLYRLPLDSGLPQQLTFDNRVLDSVSGARQVYAGNGEHVVFLAGISFSTQSLDLYTVPLDGSALPVQLNKDLLGFNVGFPSDWVVTPDGNQVLYTADAEVDGRYDLYSVSALGGASTRINVIDGLESLVSRRFRLDPSGSRVVYTSRYEGASNLSIFTRQISGGPEVELAVGHATRDDTSILINGFADDSLIFTSDATASGDRDLHAVSLDGGPVKRISDVGDDSEFRSAMAISPDGRSVVFTVIDSRDSNTSRTENSIYHFDFETDSLSKIGDFTMTGCCVIPRVKFSPEGNYFIVSESGFSPTLFNAGGDKLRDLDGSSFAFHPDGESLVFLDSIPVPVIHSRTELYMERLDGAGLRYQLSDDGNPTDDVIQFRFTDDPSVMMYMRGHARSSSQPNTLYSVQFIPEPATFVMAFLGFAVLLNSKSRKRFQIVDCFDH